MALLKLKVIWKSYGLLQGEFLYFIGWISLHVGREIEKALYSWWMPADEKLVKKSCQYTFLW